MTIHSSYKSGLKICFSPIENKYPKESSLVNESFTRLPTNVYPIHYEVFLKTNLQTFTFSGSVRIQLKVETQTNKIVLNAAELDVTYVEVNNVTIAHGNNGGPGFILDATKETMAINLGTTLQKGSDVTLTCNFIGTLNNQMRGFYRSRTGEERYEAVTQFQTTNARRCFPCWDEPSFKATFQLTVSGPNDRTILSNTPPVENTASYERTPGYKTVTFEKTPIMSTYLVAVAVGDYDYLEKRINRKQGEITVRTYTPVGAKEHGKYVLDATVSALKFFSSFFGIPYPMKKFDSVFISDYEKFAMENWGLAVYRASFAMIDENESRLKDKQMVWSLVCHEVAHQWFGNLVTMEWWTDLWLNEGFATFAGNLCQDEMMPEHEPWTIFVNEGMIDALGEDASVHSHPVQVTINNPLEIDHIFDTISYNKGAAINRMLYNYIGKESMKSGLQAYLENHAYANTITDDLWSALGKASGKPVAEIMSNWTGLMGFPLLTVKRINGKTNELQVAQERFSEDGSIDKTNKYHWQIPIEILTPGRNNTIRILLKERSTIVTSPYLSNNAWFKVNSNFTGFYRVMYENERDKERLMLAVKEGKISELDRLELLNDIFALVYAGRASTIDAFKTIEAFKVQEEGLVCWSQIVHFLDKLSSVLSDSEYYDNSFMPYVLNVVSKIASKIGWEKAKDEPSSTSELRKLILGVAGRFGDKSIRTEANRRFIDHVSGKTIIPTDMRSTVYEIVSSMGDAKTYGQLLKLFRDSDIPPEKELLVKVMGLSSDVKVLTEVLAFSVSKEVWVLDTPHIISVVANNRKGRDIAWNFFKKNWALFMNRYKFGDVLEKFIWSVTAAFNTEEQAKDVDEFFKKYPNVAERAVKKRVDKININAAWLKRDGDKISKYLEEKKF